MATPACGASEAPSELPKFPTPFVQPDYQDTGFPMRTLVEVQLDKLTHSIRTKPQWWQKVHVADIVQKWRAEAAEQGVPEALFEFGIKLRHLSNQCTPDGVRPSPVSGVFESDCVLSGEDLRETLLEALKPLEDAPEGELDWHPGSDKQVLDLVHPSLYPLVYGLSCRIPVALPSAAAATLATETEEKASSAAECVAKMTLGEASPPNMASSGPAEATTLAKTEAETSEGVLQQPHHPAAEAIVAAFGNWKTYMGAGDLQPPILPQPRSNQSFTSARFQWLPVDVVVDSSGGVKFLSYINNVHPEWHAPLYPATAALLQRTISLFERVLAESAAPKVRVIHAPFPTWEPDFHDWHAMKTGDHPDWEEDEDREDSYELWDQEKEFQEPKVPEEFMAPPTPPAVSLRGRTLQVIVKYASIVLTPEAPEYKGGTWHVEGMKNESIVASAIAYLRCENTTTSRLAFRSMVDEPDYEQSDHDGVMRTYGWDDEDALNDPIGAVDCEEGRVVVFPNVLQHRVQPFGLKDASKAGRRTIAALFLVDPATRIISTSDIPPQQVTWHDAASGLRSLFAPEVFELLEGKRDFPMGLAQAKALREELMHERKYMQDENREEWFEREFSLCEH